MQIQTLHGFRLQVPDTQCSHGPCNSPAKMKQPRGMSATLEILSNQLGTVFFCLAILVVKTPQANEHTWCGNGAGFQAGGDKGQGVDLQAEKSTVISSP